LQDRRLTALWPSCTALLRHGVWGTRAAALRLQPDALASAATKPLRNANGAGAGPNASGYHVAEPASRPASADTPCGGQPHAGMREHHAAGRAEISRRPDVVIDTAHAGAASQSNAVAQHHEAGLDHAMDGSLPQPNGVDARSVHAL
jgi:hypothetical protein